MTTGSNATCHVSRPRREGRRDGTARATCTCWIPVREADLRGCERVEIDGEYVLLIEYVRAGVSVSVARARRRECLARANALIEEHARARDSLVAIEPVIAGLTENGARRALLARIAAVGGSVAVQMAQGQVVASLDRLAQGAPLFDPLFGRVLFRVGHCRFPFVNGVETGAGLAIAMSPGLMWFRHVIYRSGRVPGRSAGDLRARKGRVQSHGVGAGTAANCYAVSPQDPSAP